MLLRGEATLRFLLEPIQEILDDQAVKEIVIQKPCEIGVEREDWTWSRVDSFDYERLDAIGILAGSRLSKPFDPSHPICMSTLPDGQRLTLCRPPVTPPGTISMTIRLPSKQVHTIHEPDFEALLHDTTNQPRRLSAGDNQLLQLYHAQDWTNFFSCAVKQRKTIAATGATGSGKTSLLRRLMREIPEDERLITLEDTEEFGELPHRNRVSLFYGSAGITAEKTVECSLRQRPDRILLQELRGAEAFAYIRAIAAGHPGSQTTWHADDGDPFTPLALMVKTSEAGRNIPDDKLMQIIRRLIDVVVFCRRDHNGFSIPSVWFRHAEEAAQ